MLSPIPLSCIATDAPHLGMHFFGFKISFWSFTSTPHWIMFNAFDTALRRNACSSVIFLARYSRLSFASDETFAYWSTKFNYNPMQIPKQQTYTRVSISVKNQILNTTMKMVTYIWTNPVVTWSVLFYIHHKLCQLYSIFTFLSKRIDFFTISGVKILAQGKHFWREKHCCHDCLILIKCRFVVTLLCNGKSLKTRLKLKDECKFSDFSCQEAINRLNSFQ